MQWATPMLATRSADAGHHFWRSLCALELLLFLRAAILSIFPQFGIAKLVSMVPERVIIIGDSFPNRLKHYLSKQYVDVSAMNWFSFGAAVCWQTKGGLTLQKLHRYHGCAMSEMAPFDAAVLQIGSNDLCTLNPDQFLEHLCEQTLPMLKGIGCKQVMVTQIFHRHVWSYTHNHNLDLYNALVDYVNSDNDNGMVYWAQWHYPIWGRHEANLEPNWGASWPGGDE